MGRKRVLAAIAALALLAAACGDDVDQDAVDEAVDDLTSDDTSDDTADDDTTTDGEADGGDTAADDDTADDDTADDGDDDDTADGDTDDDGDDAPVGVTTTAACVYLMHYPHPDFPDAPYHAFLFTQGDGITAETTAAGMLPDREVNTTVFEPFEDQPGGVDVYWPVFGPGPFDLPTVTINEFAVDVEIANTFLNGVRMYTAEGAEIREELLEPDTCDIPIMVIVDPPSGAIDG